jgi:hypothetical protein
MWYTHTHAHTITDTHNTAIRDTFVLHVKYFLCTRSVSKRNVRAVGKPKVSEHSARTGITYPVNCSPNARDMVLHELVFRRIEIAVATSPSPRIDLMASFV